MGNSHSNAVTPLSEADQLLRKYPLQHRCQPEGPNKQWGAQCYGEIAPAGMHQLLRLLSNVPECALDRASVFYDVGSGIGRLSHFVRLSTNVSKVVGVELNGCRTRRARFMQSELMNGSLALRQRLSSLHFASADITKHGFPDATHLFLSSQCWPDVTMQSILTLASTRPNLRCIVKFGHDARNGPMKESFDAWGHVARVGRADATFGPGMNAIMMAKGPCTASARKSGQCKGYDDARRTVCTFDRLFCAANETHLFNASEQQYSSYGHGNKKNHETMIARESAGGGMVDTFLMADTQRRKVREEAELRVRAGFDFKTYL